MSPAATAWYKALLLSVFIGQSFAAFEDSNHELPRAAPQQVLAAGFQHDREHACPNYLHYSSVSHPPLSKGDLGLPFQRPAPGCRTFHSPLVEKVISDISTKIVDPDLARLFENAYPNTLDTTVSWHVDGDESAQQKRPGKSAAWLGAQSFIVTGDINAEWLRDSTNQLQGYQALAAREPSLQKLILGAINTQAELVILSPYCNAFQPPPPSKLAPVANGQSDSVHPAYEPHTVFECKYELDSLAHFLRLGNEFYDHTKNKEFVTERWMLAVDAVLKVLDEQAKPAFNEETGQFQGNEYTFRRTTNAGTETLSLAGLGNPAAAGTGLIRSAFRPSDDATILPFFIPANAMMSVELKRTGDILAGLGKSKTASDLKSRAEDIEKGIYEFGVVDHKKYGKVFAFETDGYGSHILMDDANMPSLLALPFLGFVEKDDEIYKNTRKMILEQQGNPYYLKGKGFSGIGGPHIGLSHAWPMSKLIAAMTSDDDEEIEENISAVLNSSKLGLVHESINVRNIRDYTSEFETTCLTLLNADQKSRALVCMGELGVCTDHYRCGCPQATLDFRGWCEALPLGRLKGVSRPDAVGPCCAFSQP